MSKNAENRSELVDRKYRPLKKMLKKTSDDVARAVVNKRLPSALLMDDFMAQVKVMVSYPGFGDDRYPVFMAACDALYKAYKKRDQSLFDGGCKIFCVNSISVRLSASCLQI